MGNNLSKLHKVAINRQNNENKTAMECGSLRIIALKYVFRSMIKIYIAKKTSPTTPVVALSRR